jgi:DNA-binding transcriptional LysR family regulator
MLLSQLQAFLEVARARSVSRAADSLFLTQPALTARIQGLERDLGAQLFVRTPRGMKLTEAGDAFLPFAARAIETLADGRRMVNAFERGGAGKLALGAAPAVSTYVLPAVLARFSVGHPRVAVSVRTGHSEELLDLVVRDRVDLGLVRALRHPDIASTPLYEDRLLLVVEPKHRFALTGSIELAQIAGEQLVLFDRTSSYTELTNALFRGAGVVPLGVMELDNIEAAKKMVQQGFGVALLPQTAVAAELEAGLLCEIEIEDAEPVRRQIVAIRRRDRGQAIGAVASFLTLLREMQSELNPERPRPVGEPRRVEEPPARPTAPGPSRSP